MIELFFLDYLKALPTSPLLVSMVIIPVTTMEGASCSVWCSFPSKCVVGYDD